jgi:Sybindin-like family
MVKRLSGRYVPPSPSPPPSQLLFGILEPISVTLSSWCHACRFHRCRDESFVGYRTSTYKLHLFETASGYRFIMLSDPNADSLRFVMRSIYTGPFLDYVVRNPLVPMDSNERGVDNEYFRASVDRLVRGLSIFQ